jgi:hypothetical protein
MRTLQGNRVAPVSRDSVKFLHELESYGLARAAEIYNLFEEGQTEKHRAQREYEELKKIPLKKTDMQKVWIESFDYHNDQFQQLLIQTISANYRRKDPLAMFRMEQIPPHALIPKEIFLSAIDNVPERPNAITAVEFRKREQAILKRIKSAEKKIEQGKQPELLFNGFYMPEAFFEAWRSRQRYIIDKCDARGFHLDHCKKDAQEAHRIAEIASARIPGKAHYQAYVPS